MGAGEGAKVMKKEYKRYITMFYCYDPNTNTCIRIDVKASSQIFDITTFNFKLSDWDEMGCYQKCTKKEFKTALSAAIKRLREVTK